MAHTNNTEHYELSQFLATDKPAWLTDYNTDMEKIDTAMHGMQSQMDDDKAGLDAAVEVLQDRATSCENRLTEVEGRATDLESRMTTAEGRLDVDEANITGNTNRVGVLEGKVADLEAGQGLAPDSITTAMLQDRCVTTDKIALNSVTTDEILNGTIQYEDLSSDLVRHLVNMMHPVGSVYLSLSGDPNSLFPGTTWVRQTGGVLYMSNSDSDNGVAVGSDSKTLVEANLPSHTHSFTGGGSTVTGGMNGWSDGTPHINLKGRTISSDPMHDLHIAQEVGGTAGSSINTISTSGSASGWTYADAGSLQSGSWNHTHNVTVSGSIGNTGSGTAFDVKQAGVNVSVWKRTA